MFEETHTMYTIRRLSRDEIIGWNPRFQKMCLSNPLWEAKIESKKILSLAW